MIMKNVCITVPKYAKYNIILAIYRFALTCPELEMHQWHAWTLHITFPYNVKQKFKVTSYQRNFHVNLKSYMFSIIYIYKVVIGVCLFVCQIITQKLLNRFASSFDLGPQANHGNVLNLILRFKIKLYSENLVFR